MTNQFQLGTAFFAVRMHIFSVIETYQFVIAFCFAAKNNGSILLADIIAILDSKTFFRLGS